MFDLTAYLERNNARIDQALDGFLPPVTRAGRLAEAMRYSVMAGGKRLRPNLCLAAAEAVGGDSGDAVPAACALEMIHTYSLIHDDLPAMDNDRLRRGRPTCHIAFDEATAILAGDALLTLAFETVAVHSPGPVERRTEVVRLLASAAGPAGMVGGQMLDMLSEGRALDQTELEGLHRLKTGALIEASLACGAVLAGGSAVQLETLREYGRL
ncbi:polyprenyl synthetase family protein, partial [bacterium]|nr:polyprenyl synthetase family protein [bacterium]